MKKGIFFRLTEEEFAVIEGYCLDTGRSKSDVLRELVRKLKNKKAAKKHRSQNHSLVIKP
jgi:hypothetical protein